MNGKLIGTGFLAIAGLLLLVGSCRSAGATMAAAPVTPTATVVATVTPVTLPAVTSAPVRVAFKRGAWGETLTGSAGTTYLLWAAQGQTFTTTLTSHSTALVSLYGPDGKPLYEQLAAGYTAAAKLPTNGDYTLEVRSGGAYTVGVEIR